MSNGLDRLTLSVGALLALAGALDGRVAPSSSPTAIPPVAAPITSASATPVSACAPLSMELPSIESPESPAVPHIEDVARGGRAAMAPFYGHLAEVLRGNATDHARIGVYGDSNGVRDFMSGAMRRTIQTRSGDGGHGFMAIGRPWLWFQHMDVRHPASTLHEVFITFTVTDHPARDGFYGHGLISAHSLQGGAMTWLATAAEGAPIGRAASRADVHFLRGPQMGTFDIRVDGETLRTVDTSASAWEAGFADVRFPDGPHVVKLVVQRGRSVRFFGMALERDTPGVVLDALGVGMLNCRWMLRENATTFRATLARRAYDLIVFHLGTMTRPADYAPCMDVVVGRIREALPNVSILVMSPPDFPDFDGPRDPPRSAPWVAKVRDTQRRYAAEHGLAFFDFFEAMGGNASMSRFRKEKMEVGDSTHFNEKGGDYMGRRVVYAIWRDFARWLRDHPSAGCANETAMAPAR